MNSESRFWKMPLPDKSYWFPAKRYGWGWGPPVVWQGWAVLLGYVACIAALAWWVPPTDAPLLFFALVNLATLVLVLICWRTGEPPRWRWGGK